MKDKWIYGTAEITGGMYGSEPHTIPARKHRRSGIVQTVKNGFWYEINSWWWPGFWPAPNSGVPQNGRTTNAWRSLCKLLRNFAIR